MVVTLLGIVNVCNNVHSLSALLPIYVTDAPSCMVVNLSHDKKAFCSILVTLPVIVTDCKLVAPWNAPLPILVTLVPISTL